MSLPFFHPNSATHNYEPIYQNLFEIKFLDKNFNVIQDDILGIQDDYFTFNLSDNLKEYYNIKKILGKVFDLIVIVHDKQGDVIYVVEYEGFQFLDVDYIKSFVNFNYNSNEIQKLYVKFSYIKLNFHESELIFNRKRKLRKLNEF